MLALVLVAVFTPAALLTTASLTAALRRGRTLRSWLAD